MLVLREEIGEPITIGSLIFSRFDSGGPGNTTFTDFEVSFALTDLDSLGSVFASNYIQGSKMTVFSRSTLEISANADENILLALDTPFFYGNEKNLLIEVEWSGFTEIGDPILSWNWPTNQKRTVVGSYGSAGGTIFSNSAPWLILEPYQSLVNSTWGRIKVTFSPEYSTRYRDQH